MGAPDQVTVTVTFDVERGRTGVRKSIHLGLQRPQPELQSMLLVC